MQEYYANFVFGNQLSRLSATSAITGRSKGCNYLLSFSLYNLMHQHFGTTSSLVVQTQKISIFRFLGSSLSPKEFLDPFPGN